MLLEKGAVDCLGRDCYVRRPMSSSIALDIWDRRCAASSSMKTRRRSKSSATARNASRSEPCLACAAFQNATSGILIITIQAS